MTGIMGVDCSGSKTYLPLFVGACYSKERKNMEEAYKKIKALAAKENRIFGYTREIKAVNLKSESTMEQIMGEISKLEFNVLEIESGDFHLLKKTFSGSFRWELKLESVFWFLAIRKLLAREPEKIFLDVHYTKPSDAKLFEFLLARFSEKENIRTDFSTISSKMETAVKLADIAAGILRKNGSIRTIYKNKVFQLNMKETLQLMGDIRKI